MNERYDIICNYFPRYEKIIEQKLKEINIKPVYIKNEFLWVRNVGFMKSTIIKVALTKYCKHISRTKNIIDNEYNRKLPTSSRKSESNHNKI